MKRSESETKGKEREIKKRKKKERKTERVFFLSSLTNFYSIAFDNFFYFFQDGLIMFCAKTSLELSSPFFSLINDNSKRFRL